MKTFKIKAIEQESYTRFYTIEAESKEEARLKVYHNEAPKPDSSECSNFEACVDEISEISEDGKARCIYCGKEPDPLGYSHSCKSEGDEE